MKLPIINGRYLRLISNRESYQNKETMERFVHSMGWTSFEDFKKCKEEYERKFSALNYQKERNMEQYSYFRTLLDNYKTNEPYIKNHNIKVDKAENNKTEKKQSTSLQDRISKKQAEVDKKEASKPQPSKKRDVALA